MEALKTRKEALQNELEQLQVDYKKSVQTLKNNKVEIISQNEKFKTLLTEKEEKEKSLEKRKKIMELMPSGEENLQKLREIISKKKTKILGIQDQFELHKKSMLEDREKLKREIEELRNTFLLGKKENEYVLKGMFGFLKERYKLILNCSKTQLI